MRFCLTGFKQRCQGLGVTGYLLKLKAKKFQINSILKDLKQVMVGQNAFKNDIKSNLELLSEKKEM